MPIETICKGCARKLRVGDEHAGKKARCPSCGNIYVVPASPFAREGGVGGEPPDRDSRQSGASPFGPEASLPDRWYLETADGQSYGPVSRKDLDGWVAEGRGGPGSSIRQEGAGVSIPASDVYPSLASGMSSAAGANPFAREPDSGAANPYASPRLPQSTDYYKAHRGGLILTLGIMALCCNICFIPGICAWTMGQADLSAIDSGQMDPSGRGTTQAGMVLGIIGTILAGISIVINIALTAAGN